MATRLDELAGKSAQKNGGISANYIAANQALRDDLVEYLESKFSMLQTELQNVKEELVNCKNELKITQANEERLRTDLQSIDLILGGYFRHIPNCYDVRFKRATQNWFP